MLVATPQHLYLQVCLAVRWSCAPLHVNSLVRRRIAPPGQRGPKQEQALAPDDWKQLDPGVVAVLLAVNIEVDLFPGRPRSLIDQLAIVVGAGRSPRCACDHRSEE